MENYQKGMNESFIRQQNPYINQNMPPRGLNGPGADMRYRQYSQPPSMAQNKRPQDSLYLSRGHDVHPSDNRYNLPHQQIPHHSNTMSTFQPHSQSQSHSQSQPMNQPMNQSMNQSNSSSMLSNIAPPSGNFNMGNHYLRPQTVSELVLVPVELASFAAEPKFQQILLRVKEESKINYISLNRMSDNFVESIAIDAQNKESAQLARYLIETHLKLQMKVKLAETRLQKIQTDLFSTQGEIAAGQMIEFAVKPQLIGLAIGKKGSRIKQIEVETGVSSINVTDNGQIMIYGPDSQSVQKARELLEIFEDSFELHPHQAEWLLEKGNSQILGDLKSGANLMLVKVNKENSTLEVVGTGTSVQMARCLLSTQMEYVDRQMEIERNEKEAREKLHAVRKQYGLSNQWKGKKGNNPYNNEAETLPTDLKITINNPNAPTQSKPQAQLDSLYAFAQRNSGNENTNKFDKNQKEEKKKSDDSGVMDTKNLEKSMVDAALDALISKDYPDEEPKYQQRKKNNKPMDSLMPNSNNKNESKEKGKKESEVNNSKNQGKSNRGSKEEVNYNKSSPILTSNQHDTKSKNANTQKSDKNDKNDRNDRNDKSSNKGKNNEREKSANEKKIDNLLPPPPTLTVPPVPPQENDDKKNDPKNSRRKNKKGSKGEGDQEPSQSSNRQNNLKNGKEEKKEPMLIKINNPFAEKIKLEIAEDNDYDEFIPQASKSSGPPKEPPSSIALASSNASVSKPPGLERVAEQKQDNQGENKKNSKNRKNEKSATKKTPEVENIESMIEDLHIESKQSNETSVTPTQAKTEESDNSSKNKEGKKKSKNKEAKKLNSSEEDSLPTKEASLEDEN